MVEMLGANNLPKNTEDENKNKIHIETSALLMCYFIILDMQWARDSMLWLIGCVFIDKIKEQHFYLVILIMH